MPEVSIDTKKRAREARVQHPTRRALAGLGVTTKRSYTTATMEIEWDADKAARNLTKHGVSFEDAALVFYDSNRVEAYDGRADCGEGRWATIGLAYCAVLYVVYTVRHEHTIRLISARKANASERKHYRQAHP